MSRLATLAVLLLSAAPSLAASFMVKHGHWTVARASTVACAAFNRPPEEFNYAPYNALSLRQRRDRPMLLQVFAWPGQFKHGEATTIAVTIEGTRWELPAQAVDTYMAETKEALAADLLGRLRNARTAEIEITGLPQHLLFDVSDFGAVSRSLEDCMRQLPKG